MKISINFDNNCHTCDEKFITIFINSGILVDESSFDVLISCIREFNVALKKYNNNFF